MWFSRTTVGAGPFGRLSTAALAIANAVQFNVCSGVLRVLGLARAGPKRASFLVIFCAFPKEPYLVVLGALRIVLTERGRECGDPC